MHKVRRKAMTIVSFFACSGRGLCALRLCLDLSLCDADFRGRISPVTANTTLRLPCVSCRRLSQRRNAKHLDLVQIRALAMPLAAIADYGIAMSALATGDKDNGIVEKGNA